MPPIFISTILQSVRKEKTWRTIFHDVKLRLLAHSRSFLANQKARNAIVGAENLLKTDICQHGRHEHYSEDISDVTNTITQYSRTSNDCRFTYMQDFILKPAEKLEYQDNASLFKFKGNPSIDTCRKSRRKFVRE